MDRRCALGRGGLIRSFLPDPSKVQLALRGVGRSKNVLLHAPSVGPDGQMERLNAMQEPLLGDVLSEIALDFCELLFR